MAEAPLAQMESRASLRFAELAERHSRSVDSQIHRHHRQAFSMADRLFYPDIIEESAPLFQSRPRR
jgi:hypothetical protein